MDDTVFDYLTAVLKAGEALLGFLSAILLWFSSRKPLPMISFKTERVEFSLS
jgi:hypothetical protein